MVDIASMEFFCYHRDRPGSVGLRNALREEHWSYMDRYAAELIARGPTFACDDDDEPTASVHIVNFSGPTAARDFAFDEPNYQAGVYRYVLLRRWRNVLGRTMWDFPSGDSGGNRYLVLGFGSGQAADLDGPSVQDELIAYGPVSNQCSLHIGTRCLPYESSRPLHVVHARPWDDVLTTHLLRQKSRGVPGRRCGRPTLWARSKR